MTKNLPNKYKNLPNKYKNLPNKYKNLEIETNISLNNEGS